MVNSLQMTSVILQITCIRSQIQQTAFITANDWIVSHDYDFHVTSSIGATSVGPKWNIDVVTQYGSDLSIELGSSWGFHPTFPSFLSFIVNGSTSYETLQDDANILFVFSVSGKYFTTAIPFNTSQTPFTIYPQPEHALESTIINNMMSASSPPRTIRYTQNNSWYMAPIIPSNASFQDVITWPIYITITNDPAENTVTYEWKDAIHPQIITTTYNTSFKANAVLKMHIAGDIPNEQFTIYSFNISNHIVNDSTLNPTSLPSKTPTTAPISTTIKPSTTVPTTTPTLIPTITPTSLPTILSTTIIPTSKRPSTESPTNAPTEIPTVSTTISLNTTPIIYSTDTISTTLDITSTEPLLTSTINEDTTSLSTTDSTSISLTTHEMLDITTSDKIYSTEKSSTENPNDSGEVREETTSTAAPLIVDSTAASGSHSFTINFDSVVPYVLVTAILLFGLICFIVGLCVGVSLYRRENVARNNNEDKRDSVESELAEQIANNEKQLSAEVDVVVIHIEDNENNNDEDNDKDTDDDKSMYDDDGEAITKPELDDEQEVESLPDAPIHIQEHRNTISDDGESHILDILCAPQEHNVNVNDAMYGNSEIVIDPPYIHKVKQKKAVSVSDNISVSYADGDHDDEKDNRLIKTRTPGQKGIVKQYGIVQPDVFPDDEGTDMMRPMSIKSEIEIEMQRRLEKRKEKQKVEEEKYFKLLKKIMLDEEGSGISDMNDADVIGPLPELQNINQLSVKSMLVYQHNKKAVQRKSLSHSNKTGRSFETVIDDEKQIEITDDEADDEGLEDLTHDDTVTKEKEEFLD